MTVLVAYASAHGSTKQVADAIADRLRTAGLDVAVRAAVDVDDVVRYDDVILGSAIHNGRWLTPASTLAAELREYPERRVWMFSVCTIGETTSFLGTRLSRLARSRRPLPDDVAKSGAPHRYFAGVIEKSHWNAVGRLFFAVTGGGYGDRRDWADIDRWADLIAAAIVEAGSG